MPWKVMEEQCKSQGSIMCNVHGPGLGWSCEFYPQMACLSANSSIRRSFRYFPVLWGFCEDFLLDWVIPWLSWDQKSTIFNIAADTDVIVHNFVTKKGKLFESLKFSCCELLDRNCWWRSLLVTMSAVAKCLPNLRRRMTQVTSRTFVMKSDKVIFRPISNSVQPCHAPLLTPLFKAERKNLHTTTPLSSSPSPAEESLISALSASFPSATDIAVVDISGGCGSMYEVFVEAPDFKGVRVVKQHQMVTKALSTQIKDMHGIRISTAVSPCKSS